MKFLPSKSNRRVFGKVAEEYDLVYFGTVDPLTDTGYKAIRGLTLSPQSRDENYTTGNVYDYEVAFLQRSREVLTSSSGRSKTKRSWTILQIQLKGSGFPEMLVDGRNRSSEYGALLASTKRWQESGWHHFSPAFSEFFAVYSKPESMNTIADILNDETQSMLATHFRQFDYELLNDKLIIYATNSAIDLQTLDHMLRIGLWLARRLDNSI